MEWPCNNSSTFEDDNLAPVGRSGLGRRGLEHSARGTGQFCVGHGRFNGGLLRGVVAAAQYEGELGRSEEARRNVLAAVSD